MATLPSDTTKKTDQLGPDLSAPDKAKKRHRQFRKRIESCKIYKRKLISGWSLSVDYRRGKPFATQSDEDRVAVNLDWSLTKQKQAQLFSQIPAVRVNHPPQTVEPEASPWLHKYEQRINDTLISAGSETAMDECLPDCINAAGFGVIFVAHEAITDQVEVPAIDLAALPPEIHQQILQSGMLPDGTEIPMETVPRVVDHRYVISRVSPADFLWPVSFNGSDFDKAPWLGRTGRITWAEAQKRWNLPEQEKSKYLGSDKTVQDGISSDTEKEYDSGDDFVTFDEVFYWEFQYDSAAKSYSALHHLVFIHGKDDPVIDEPWQGQQKDPETGELIGAQRYPIRVLTLSYITDEAIPPSDSAVGRPQVDEINKARTQMILQREHSLPVRWFDVNRIDPTIQYTLMRGVWQGMIPVQGQGTNIIGEVARSQMAPENFTFYDIAKRDFLETAGVGQGFSGSDVETKGESQNIQANANTRISRERALVGKFFTSIAEVLGGLICVYEDPGSFGEGFSPVVSKTLSYSILADSTVLLDSNQRLQRLMQFINFTGKSGWVNIEPVLREIATLSGLDPSVVIQPPSPKPPSEPNISLRLTGTEDLLSPMAVAMLMKSGQAPDEQLIEQAKKLIEKAVTPPPMQVPQVAPDGSMLPPSPLDAPPEPAPPGVGEANPDWSAFPKVNQRVLDREGGDQ